MGEPLLQRVCQVFLYTFFNIERHRLRNIYVVSIMLV